MTETQSTPAHIAELYQRIRAMPEHELRKLDPVAKALEDYLKSVPHAVSGIIPDRVSALAALAAVEAVRAWEKSLSESERSERDPAFSLY